MIVLPTDLHRVECVAFSPCGTAIAAGGVGVEVWNTSFERLWGWNWARVRFQGSLFVRTLAFTADARHLLAQVPSQQLYLLDADTGEGRSIRTGVFDHLAVSPTRWQFVATGGRNFFACQSETDARNEPQQSSNWAHAAHPATLFECSAFSHDGQLVVNHQTRGAAPANFVLFDSNTGMIVREVPSRFGHLEELKFSPDGQYLAARRDGAILLWSADHLRRVPRRIVNDTPKKITSFAFHPNGKNVATTSNDQSVKLWDLETQEQVRAFDWHGGRMRSIAFAPDGLTAAAGGEDGQLILFDVDL